MKKKSNKLVRFKQWILSIVIARTWNNFWYEWISPPSHLIRYGGGVQGYSRFRKQRLINVIIIVMIIAIGLYVL